MEASEPIMSLRSKSELYKEARRAEEGREAREQVSLESAFNRFINAPHVAVYFSLIPLLGDLMERIKPRCIGPELMKHFDALLRETQNPGSFSNNKEALRRVVKEINSHLDALEEQIEKLVDIELDRLEIESERKFIHRILRQYWAVQREDYLTRTTGLGRLTHSYVLRDMLGFNMQDKADVYEQRWLTAIWEYLHERDRYNMEVIASLESTQRELDSLYLTMKNVVTFKSLVILTIWRLHHAGNDNSVSIMQLLNPDAQEDDDHDWTLAYGTFFKDYQLFMHWHQQQFEGRPVHIYLYYIDFEASAASSAILVDMVNNDDAQHHADTSLAGIFADHKERLPLSYMLSATDTPSIKSRIEKRTLKSLF